MAFTPIADSQIEAGDPVTQELWNKTQDNFDDHEARLVVVEAATASFDPIPFFVQGRSSNAGAPKLSLMKYRVVFDANILAARLIMFESGSAGTAEVDIQRKPLAGAFSSIFSTRPSLLFSAGDDAVSTNAVLSTTSITAGDILRFDQTAIQTAQGAYALYLEIEAT